MSKVTILGISAFYHDSAVCIVIDGEIVAAAQEERFSRKKHDPSFPKAAINYCLEEAEVEPDELDAVIFYDNPILSFDRIIKTLVLAGHKGIKPWCKGAPGWLNAKLFIKKLIYKYLQAPVKVLFDEHHFSHAASAFYPSPFEEAAILTLDGVGEWTTTALGYGNKKGIKLTHEIVFPHSLGLLYSSFTQFCGFKVNSGEYKLMGLAPYGNPVYVDTIKSHLVMIKKDGSFHLDMKYFGYMDSLSMTTKAFEDLFGGPARKPESRITQREMDIAASIQKVTEEIILTLCRTLKGKTNMNNLVLAGGVALNCVANGKILKEKIFDDLWIQPASGDAGGALGAALHATYEYFGVKRYINESGRDSQKGSYLGPRFRNEEIETFLENHRYPYKKVADIERAEIVAKSLAKGLIVGYMVGRMEFGPRALGARSILADARNPRTQSVMNLKIKYRESFRPFAPSVLLDKTLDYFELDCSSPYMLLVSPVQKDKRKKCEEVKGEDLLIKVNQVRSNVPAITHVDYSARVQTVDGIDKQDYFEVIKAFYKLTGCGVIVNTSFNVRGEPIVCSPEDAYRCFMRTDMDILVMENFMLYKGDQPGFKELKDWRDEYELD